MKTVKKHRTHRLPLGRFASSSQRSATAPQPAPTPSGMAQEISQRHPDTLGNLSTMIRHPRSLSRPIPTWRPPTLKLPRFTGLPHLTASVTRLRVGPRAQARLLGYGEDRTAAYLVSVRITNPIGAPVATDVAEAWIRALLGDHSIGAVHELGGTAPTYVWLTDGSYLPIPSPASLFADFSDAA